MSDPADAELVARARSGDERACRSLVERHEAAVARVVIGMLGPGDEAEDVGQDTFIRFFRALDRFRGEAAVSTYLQRIAMNLSLNALKRRKRTALRFVSRDADPAIDAATSAPDRVNTARDARDEVHAALARLSAVHRPVVVLRFIEGLSTRETAERLGIPEGTVLSRLARATAHLATLLRPGGRDGS